MGLFDKKYCDVCGEKIKLLGNRKLEDGNLCKNCAEKLSPFFSERRRSTVADIKAQLADREANRAKVDAFATSRTIGDSDELMLDAQHGCFLVHHKGASLSLNPDVLSLSQITGCEIKVEHSQTEQKTKDAEGHPISYNPPRHKHSYTFYVLIHVNAPWFDHIRMRLNSRSVEIMTGMPVERPSLFGLANTFTSSVPDTVGSADYQHYAAMAEEVCTLLTGTAQPTAEVEEEPADETRVCPYCGQAGLPDAQGKCPSCGGPMG